MMQLHILLCHILVLDLALQIVNLFGPFVLFQFLMKVFVLWLLESFIAVLVEVNCGSHLGLIVKSGNINIG